MFIGSINSHLRSVLADLAKAWKGLPIYVGCSGNFTIERILAAQGLTELHGNDVSLYSCALGAYLAGRPFPLVMQEERLAWLRDWLEPGLPAITTLLLCTTVLEFWDRDHPYHRRMWNAYVRRWPELHKQTLAKVTVALEKVRLGSFFAGDVVDFFATAPEEAVLISFPPTYKGGYERLYRKLQQVFAWVEPEYELFTAERFEQLAASMQRRKVWVLSRDDPLPDLEAQRIAIVQTGLRSKPVNVYSNQSASVLTLPHQELAPVPWPRLEKGPVEGPLRIVPLTGPQLNTLRSQYLDPKITPGAPWLSYGILAGGKLAGALAFSSSRSGGDWCQMYMLTDLAVTSAVPRLSKLVLAALLSTEMQAVLEQKMALRITAIGTTAFTTKPTSMKYRGILELHSRKEGRLNYVGQAGRWTLAGALDWWKQHHGRNGTGAGDAE